MASSSAAPDPLPISGVYNPAGKLVVRVPLVELFNLIVMVVLSKSRRTPITSPAAVGPSPEKSVRADPFA